MKRFTFILFFCFLFRAMSIHAQTMLPNEMILEFPKATEHDLNVAAHTILNLSGTHIAGISAEHDVILVKLDQQTSTSKRAVLDALDDQQLHAIEKYGTIAQVMNELGGTFTSLENFHPRER